MICFEYSYQVDQTFNVYLVELSCMLIEPNSYIYIFLGVYVKFSYIHMISMVVFSERAYS